MNLESETKATGEAEMGAPGAPPPARHREMGTGRQRQGKTELQRDRGHGVGKSERNTAMHAWGQESDKNKPFPGDEPLERH